ncbi:MAG: hypothetical protein PHF31_03780 [Methylobacter sp.]|nr:hypothetical protein [Methylobacter sp.]
MNKQGARRNLASFLMCLALLAQGCATQALYSERSLETEDTMCLRWLEHIDTKLAEYELEDAGTVRIIGFPHLRINRFLASLSDRTMAQNAFAQWLENLRQLDETTRLLEFANFPAEQQKILMSELPQGENLEQGVQRCGKRLAKLDLNDPERQRILLQQAEIPDAYQTWKRYVGAYALTQYAASVGIELLHKKLNESFQQPLAQQPVLGRLMQYAPPQTESLIAEDIAAIMRPAYDNPLAIPSLAPEQLQQLFEHFAPIWEIDTRNNNDKIGMVMLDAGGQPRIDTIKPVVYIQHAFTLWHGRVLLQLIYQIWLPAREKTGLFDLYGGPLDSVIWRVTLSPEGTPIAFDSIHACGCYYLLFPSLGYHAIPPKDDAEPVLSPMSIPKIPAGKRLLLRLATRTHYLRQIAVVPNAPGNTARFYAWQKSEWLRSIPMQNGTRHSLFGADGIINASQRNEHFLLWPFGVASPGAMRQWGTHAIAFTGRRHFDDPFLLEKLLIRE